MAAELLQSYSGDGEVLEHWCMEGMRWRPQIKEKIECGRSHREVRLAASPWETSVRRRWFPAPPVDEIQKTERRSQARGLDEGETGQGSWSSGSNRGFKKGHSRGDLGGGLASGGRHTKEEQEVRAVCAVKAGGSGCPAGACLRWGRLG
jgi:hypothetical protein